MMSHSGKQQETIDAENSENQGSSNEGIDNMWSLDTLRTCPLAFIRSDPNLRIIYDRGFVSGFYGEKPDESTVVSVPRQSAEAEIELTYANAALSSPSEAVVEKLALVAAMDSAIESGLNSALKVAEHSSKVVQIARQLLGINNEQ